MLARGAQWRWCGLCTLFNGWLRHRKRNERYESSADGHSRSRTDFCFKTFVTRSTGVPCRQTSRLGIISGSRRYCLSLTASAYGTRAWYIFTTPVSSHARVHVWVPTGGNLLATLVRKISRRRAVVKIYFINEKIKTRGAGVNCKKAVSFWFPFFFSFFISSAENIQI